MNIVITGGGTGGHLSIAKALGVECKSRGLSVIYIGSTSGQDRLWFDSNFGENSPKTTSGGEKTEIFDKCYFLETTGVVNKRGIGIFKAALAQIAAIWQCRGIFKKHKIDIVISVGGYSAGGAGLASVLCGKKLFIHEQNALMGLLNKALSPFAKKIFCSFDLGEKLAKKVIKTSYPINGDFFKTARLRENLGVMLFLGGSQGAVAINDFALKLAKTLQKMGIKIIHQCGERDLERVRREYEKMGVNAEVFAFSKQMSQKMQQADFCVSRAGASSLWELCANGLPSYFIPYPFAAKDHQYFNALALGNLCGLKRQDSLNEADFLEYIKNLDLKNTSQKLMQTIAPSGAREIIDCILE